MKEYSLTLNYEVHFVRMDTGEDSEFLKHPLAHEVDDYKAYKTIVSKERADIRIAKKALREQQEQHRLRREEREKEQEQATEPEVSVSLDPWSVQHVSSAGQEPMDYFSIALEMGSNPPANGTDLDGHASDLEALDNDDASSCWSEADSILYCAADITSRRMGMQIPIF